MDEISYLQNYSISEINLRNNISSYGFDEHNNIFGLFARESYANMETIFYSKDFTPLAIESSVNLTIKKYHFYRFSALKNKVILSGQTFSGGMDELCTVPFSTDGLTVIKLDWSGEPCVDISDANIYSDIRDANFHDEQYFLGLNGYD